MTSTKAYTNPDFMMGEDAREVRILCEYLEPKARLRRAGVHRALAFFGSARLRPGIDPDYCARATELAERLARWTMDSHPAESRFRFCSGGGPGIMEAVGKGVARVNRRLNIGLNISLQHEQHANPWLEQDLTFEFHYFFMRKFWFANLAQAVVAFPGGFGTLDELFEMLTMIQTGKIPARPVVLFGREFWSRVVDMALLSDRGLISGSDRQLFRCMDSVDDVFSYLTSNLVGVTGPEMLQPPFGPMEA